MFALYAYYSSPDLDGVRQVYPVAIVQEPLLGFWLAAKLLIERFTRRVDAVLWRLDLEVRPVAFMTIEETVVEYVRVGDFNLAEFLREKLGSDREHKLSIVSSSTSF